MICSSMPPEHRAELGQAVKTAFEYIPLRLALESTFQWNNFSPSIEMIETAFLIEEVISIAFDVPSSLHQKFYIPFTHFGEPYL
jgi:hypothetical protein